jgi:hypothetical protein
VANLARSAGSRCRGWNRGRIHPSAPQVNPIDPVLDEIPDRGRRWGERPVGEVVDGAKPAPPRRAGKPQTVAGGVAWHVRLVDGDTRQIQAVGCGDAVGTEHERTREMNDVRREPVQRLKDPRARQADPERPIAGDRNRPDPHHRIPVVVLVKSAAVLAGDGPTRSRTRLWSDDHRLMAAPGQLLDHLDHRVRHTVEVGRERLCDDRNSHGSSVRPVSPEIGTSALRVGEPWPTYRGRLLQTPPRVSGRGHGVPLPIRSVLGDQLSNGGQDLVRGLLR